MGPSTQVRAASVWPNLELARRADARVVVLAAGAGAATDFAIRSGVAGLAGTVLVTAVAAVLLAWGGIASRQARALVCIAPLFGAFLTMRMSPWLLPLDILAAGGLFVAGASLARSGSILDLPVPGLAARGVHAGVHGLAAPAYVMHGLGSLRGGGGRALLRGVALALPLLLVLGGLLASADVLFAQIFDVAPDDIGAHVVAILVGAWGMAGLLRVSAATPPDDTGRHIPLVGPVEATVVLGSLVVLFAAFAVTQVVALAGGGQQVVRTAGLTYAEYARSGFFQLVAVAAITLVVLMSLEFLTEPRPTARRRLLVGSELCIALTLVVVLSALRRLDLYDNAYGLTMLRLYASVFVGCVGVCLLLLGVWLAGSRTRAWLPAAAAGAGLAALLALNVANPEALVVRRNASLAEQTGRIDPHYLSRLSSDAVPEMVQSLPRVGAPAKEELLAHICGLPSTAEGGWAGWNASVDIAIETRNQLCR